MEQSRRWHKMKNQMKEIYTWKNEMNNYGFMAFFIHQNQQLKFIDLFIHPNMWSIEQS